MTAMVTSYLVVTVVTAVANLAAAAIDFFRVPWVMNNMVAIGIPAESWAYPLGWLKVAGAAGILVGVAVPALGVAAAAGLVLFFVGAVAAVTRGRAYKQLPFPTPMLALAVAALALRVLTL